MVILKKTWVFSVLLGLVLWMGLPQPSIAASLEAEPKILHVLNRLSFGPRLGDIDLVKSMGVEAYIKSQMAPQAIAVPQSLTQQVSSLKTLRMTPASLKMTVDSARSSQGGKQPTPEAIKLARQQETLIRQQAIQGRLLRAIASPRQLEEVMVDFWSNHFNVFADKGLDRLWVGTYDELAIRPYALGKFRQLLGATAHHPAMLYYLDNGQSRAGKLNENYAREVMELHTLGVNSGYTQEDVIALARILTGWGFTRPQKQVDKNHRVPPIEGEFYFDSKRHDFGEKVFLLEHIKGTGMDEGEQALDILAHHPATARHISYKLAQYFLTDSPPPPLVNEMALRFLKTDGDIPQVLDTLFHSAEFWDAKYYNAKFKTPYQYIISAIRATGTDVKNFDQINNLLTQMGMPLYGCQFPDGYKNTEEAWLSPDVMLRRISFTTALAGGGFGRNKPVDAQQLSKTLGNIFSSQTQTTIEKSPPQMHATLMLGSPEFMRH